MKFIFKYAVFGLLNLLCVNNEVVAVHGMDIWGLLTWGITLPLLYWSVILRYVPHCIYSLYPSYTVALVATMVGWTECSKFSITMANTTTDLRSGIKFCAKNSEDYNVTSVGTDHQNLVITLCISTAHYIVLTIIIMFFASLLLDTMYWNKLYSIESFFVRHLLVSDIIAVLVNSCFACAIAL